MFSMHYIDMTLADSSPSVPANEMYIKNSNILLNGSDTFVHDQTHITVKRGVCSMLPMRKIKTGEF